MQFLQKENHYLGHEVSDGGIHTDPSKIAAIKELQPPTTVKELRRCLGISFWFVWAIRKWRCYLEDYEFDVITDHLAIKWLNSIENPTGLHARHWSSSNSVAGTRS